MTLTDDNSAVVNVIALDNTVLQDVEDNDNIDNGPLSDAQFDDQETERDDAYDVWAYTGAFSKFITLSIEKMLVMLPITNPIRTIC